MLLKPNLDLHREGKSQRFPRGNTRPIHGRQNEAHPPELGKRDQPTCFCARHEKLIRSEYNYNTLLALSATTKPRPKPIAIQGLLQGVKGLLIKRRPSLILRSLSRWDSLLMRSFRNIASEQTVLVQSSPVMFALDVCSSCGHVYLHNPIQDPKIQKKVSDWGSNRLTPCINV